MDNHLSIVIPIYKEKKNIELLTKDIYQKIKKKIKFEIIFVDDNSKDGSYEILKKLNKKKLVKFVIRKKEKKDLTKSCFLGIEISKFPNVLVMDGDLQHDPKYIIKMLNLFSKKKLDIVVGARNFKEKNINRSLTFLRITASKILKFFINIFLGHKTSDPLSGFFLFKKKIFYKNKNKFYGCGYKILADFLYSDNSLKISEIKITFKKRIYGHSKMDFKVLALFTEFFIQKYLKKKIKS